MNIREGLNPAQQQAIEVDSGPLLILAGAGSGKTKTLTHRIAHLIANHGVWPSQILAVTFTNKAAREMRERLAALLNEANTRGFMPWMGTFHGICVRLLRQDGQAINLASQFVIYDEDDRQAIIKQVMKSDGVTDSTIKPRAVSAAISNAKNNLQSPAEYEAQAHYPFQRHVAKLYAGYEREKSKANALDFDDLLLETVRLLQEKPDIRHKWQHQFKHILIDEYQDTNAAQYRIVQLLVNADRNICVVGDDWQSIYSWRGADFTNILNFERDYKGAHVIKLEQNYRSTGAILDAAHAVIAKNVERTEKTLWTAEGAGSPVQVHEVYDEVEEAQTIASRIGAQTAIGARNAHDFAVLYRTNAQSYVLERALLQARIPYHIVGGVRFYDRAEIKDIIAYLRLLYQPHDRVSFSRIANVPTRGLGATSLERFITWQSNTGLSLIEAMQRIHEADGLTPRAKQSFSKLAELLLSIDMQQEPSLVLQQLIEKSGYLHHLRDGSPKAEEREENIASLVSDAKQFTNIHEFLEEVALMSSADQAQTADSVTLMTLHAAKGLEFPVVFMVGLEEGIFPHSRVYEAGPSELEEERRLCYVGMTRAREELHLSYAASRLQFGQRAYNPASRFIADMGSSILTTSERSAMKDNEHEAVMPDFDINDRVNSRQFGDGTVVDIDGLAVSIQFDSGQTKKLNIEYARLQRL